MILWKFKEKPETRGDDMPCSAFRWVFEVGWVNVGFVHQHQYKRTGEWNSSHTGVYEAVLNTKFALGKTHFYYDGPHCGLSLGWLHLNWGGNPMTGWCKKCENPDVFVLHDEHGNEIKGVYGKGLECFLDWWDAFTSRRELIKRGEVSRSSKIVRVSSED